MKRLLQLLAIVIIAIAIWKKGIPWWEARQHRATAEVGTGAGSSCIELAEHASEVWGSGIGHFANPPYDLDAWGTFRTRVDTAIARAEALCACGEDSCRKSREAMSDLRSLVSELDGSIRGGTPPPDDMVQRQARIDETINAARDAVRAGK